MVFKLISLNFILFFLSAVLVSSRLSVDSSHCMVVQRLLPNEDEAYCKSTLSQQKDSLPLSVNVTATIYINALSDSENDAMIKIGGYLHLQWLDNRLTWSQNKGSKIVVDKVKLKRKSIWMPDVGFASNQDSIMADLRRKDIADVEVESTGFVTLFSDFDISVVCLTNVFLFPFDKSKCMVRFGAITSSKDNMQLTLKFVHLFADKIDLGSILTNWNVVNMTFENSERFSKLLNHSMSTSEISFLLKRKAIYYIYILAMVAILFITLATILFHAVQQSDRVIFASIIFISMALYMIMCSQLLPKSMNSPSLLCIYFLVQIGSILIFILPLTFCGHNNERLHVEGESSSNASKTLLFVIYILVTLINSIIFFIIIPLVAP